MPPSGPGDLHQVMNQPKLLFHSFLLLRGAAGRQHNQHSLYWKIKHSESEHYMCTQTIQLQTIQLYVLNLC